MLQKIASFFRSKRKETDDRKNSSFREKMEEERRKMNEELAKGNNVAWHRIIMAVVIGFVGILLCAVIFAKYLMEKQQEELMKPYRFLQLSEDELAHLPSGEYMVCGAFRTSSEDPDMIWLLCRKRGGIIVAARMPEGTQKPMRPPVSLTVSENGSWEFTYPQAHSLKPPQDSSNAGEGKTGD